MPPVLLITDTNIWIDLENGGLLEFVFQLPYRFVTPDFAVPEFVRPAWIRLQTLGLEALELDPEQVRDVYQLKQKQKNLSVVDLAAFQLAQTLSAMLITGDRRLTDLANAEGVIVHGALWLLDELLNSQVLTSQRAADALQRMLDQGARLPANDCRKRFETWSTRPKEEKDE